MNKSVFRILLGVVIVAYFIMPIVFLPEMMGSSDEHKIMNMAHCPYEAGENSMCPFDFSLFLLNWHRVLVNVSPNILALFSFVLLFYFASQIYLDKFWRQFLYFKNQRFRFYIDLYKILFQKGIINGKPY